MIFYLPRIKKTPSTTYYHPLQQIREGKEQRGIKKHEKATARLSLDCGIMYISAPLIESPLLPHK